MVKRVCDRCGKDVDRTNACVLRIYDNDPMICIYNEEIDLCAECKKELDKFLGLVKKEIRNES